MDVKDIAARALTRPSVYVPALVDEIERLRAALQSIADSACCDKCQEAALWARAALAAGRVE